MNVEFVPSTQANKMEAKAKPLGTLLQKQLHIPVHVTVSTDYSGLVEAMSSKKVDVGFMPPYSYILAHKKGIADVLLQDCKLVNVKGDDQEVLSVLNGDVDAAFVFSDARNIAAKDDKKAMTDVVPIYFTKWIPNDTIAVRKDMPKKFRVKLAKAFKNIAKSKKGKQIIESIYNHYGYVEAKDSDFDGLRQYQKIVNKATGGSN